MSTQTPDGVYSLPAGADLSNSQYQGVVINTSGQFVLAGAGVTPHGILQNRPVAGEQARVELIGKVLKGKVGTGGSTVGAKMTMSATGTYIVGAIQGNALCAIALDAVAAGAIARMYHVPDLGAVP